MRCIDWIYSHGRSKYCQVLQLPSSTRRAQNRLQVQAGQESRGDRHALARTQLPVRFFFVTCFRPFRDPRLLHHLDSATTFNFVPSFLWNNAGFTILRRIPELQNHEPRYDPTVIPTEEPKSLVPDLRNLPVGAPREKSSTGAARAPSAADFHDAFRTGKTTPLQVAQAFFDELARSPEHQKAFLDVRKELVIEAAEASTERYRYGNHFSPLDGVLVGVKDEVDLAGYSKSLGSSRNMAKAGDKTSWCVRKWEEAGAVVVGKLNMHELGMDTTNSNPIRGTPLNPHNSSYYTGGSSGGSAYAIAAGLLPIALGADGGGSIRIPSSYCGIFGLKPSHGRVSGSPTQSLALSCGVLGPMCGSMADLEIAYRVMAQPDPANPKSAAFPNPLCYAAHSAPSVGQKVMGIFPPWIDAADPPVQAAFHAALDFYRLDGYQLVDIDLPLMEQGQLAHAITILSELSVPFYPYINDFSAANKLLLSIGHQTPAHDFLLAQKMRQLLMKHLAALFAKYPSLLIVSPTTPNLGWPISGGAAELKRGCNDANTSVRNMLYIWLANFSGCPAISIPIGSADPSMGKGKVPIGMTAMTRWGGEEVLIEWGKRGEEWAQRTSNLPVPVNRVDLLQAAETK